MLDDGERIATPVAERAEPEVGGEVRAGELPAGEDELYLFPTTFAQRGLWILDRLEPGNPFYNCPRAFRIRNRIDWRVLRRALQEIVARHETLRTSFLEVDGTPMQVIDARADLHLLVADLRGLAETRRESELQRLMVGESMRPFDLTRGPLMRVVLVRLEAEHWGLHFNIHHIVSDGWSMEVLVHELGMLYRAYREGRRSPLPELEIQYADFAEWQQRGSAEGGYAEQLEYWRRQLGGELPTLDLPLDRPRPPLPSHRGGDVPLALSPPLTAALRSFAAARRATPFMTLMAALQATLAFLARQEEVIVGTMALGRDRPELEGLIGYFLNNLAIRGDLRGDPSLGEHHRRIREVMVEAYRHQDVPFLTLLEELELKRGRSHSPVFQVMLSIENAIPKEPGQLPLEGLEPIEIGSRTSKFDLYFAMFDLADGYSGLIEYSTDLFDRTTVERLAGYFSRAVEELVTAPRKRLSELAFLAPAERHQLTFEWNDTRTEPVSPPGLFELLARRFDGASESVAASAPGFALTGAGLRRGVERAARRLLDAGVAAETPVAVIADRGPDLLVALLAIFRAGGVYLPFDPAQPPRRLGLVLDDSQAPLAVVSERYRGLLAQASETLAEPPRALAVEALVSPSAPPSASPLPTLHPSRLAYLLYTSGSTGRPKGVMVPYRGMVNHLLGKIAYLGLGPGDVIAQTASQSFDISLWQLLTPLLCGGCCRFVDDLTVRDPELLVAAVARDRVTVLQLVPSLLRTVLDHLDSVPGPRSRLSSLRWLSSTGEALPPELASRWLGSFPAVPLLNAYGPTECSDDVTHEVIRRSSSAGAARVTIGRPLRNLRVELRGARLQWMPIGAVGELLVGGTGVARGYFGDPRRTAESFVPDPSAGRPSAGSPGGRVYRTGDLGRGLADARYAFLGRIDHQEKIRGFRVELGEIEAVLRRHPAVREAVTLVWRSPGRPERLVAYLAAAPGAPRPEDAGLRAALLDRLPSHMVPSHYLWLESMPLTPNGKIDRRALPQPAERPASAPPGGGPWETPAEELLAALWTRLLGVDPGREDNFFELGGHSLLATQLQVRIRKTFRVDLPLRAIFEAPMVPELARKVESRTAGEPDPLPPIRPAPRGERMPLSFGQRRLWFLHRLHPGDTMFHVPLHLRLAGRLDVPALMRTLHEVLRRHTVLRTVYREAGEEAVQRVLPLRSFSLPVVDLGALESGSREVETERLTRRQTRHTFDLERDLPVRVLLLRHSATEHVQVLTVHHIASDLWSTAILVREVAELYRAFREGRRSPLPELELQYSDYAAWQRRWLRGEVLEGHLAYWRRQLAELPEALELPWDRPRGGERSERGATLAFTVGRELTEAVRRLGHERSATLFMTLLAAFESLLHRYSGQTDLTVGTPIAGRHHLELEELVGFFVNMLVLRVGLEGTPTFLELTERIRDVALEAHAHQEVPFEKLVEELQPERTMSHTPFFQVSFVLQNAPAEVLRLPELEISGVPLAASAAQYDLILRFVEVDWGLLGSFDYRTDLFDRTTVERVARHFQVLLAGAVESPERPIASLPLLTAPERQQLAVEWNRARWSVGPGTATLVSRFENAARRCPDAVAVEGGAERLSYLRLDRLSAAVAHRLRRAGVGPGVRVGFYVDRSPSAVVGLLAILRAGAAYLPMDPAYPEERMAFMLDDAGVSAVLTEGPLRHRLPATGVPVLLLDQILEPLAAAPLDPPPAAAGVPRAEDPAYLIYTSGSTGRPKGVPIQHRQAAALFAATGELFATGAGDVWSLFHSLAFDFSVWELWGALLHGGRVLMVPAEVRRSPRDFHRLLVRSRVTVLSQTPSAFDRLLAEELRSRGRLRALRRVVFGGEALDQRALAPWLERYGDRRPELVNMYGITETTVHVTWSRLRTGRRRPASGIGRALPHLSLRVVDRRLRPVPVSVTGEIAVGGAGVAMGYLGRPGLTAERFVPDPFAEGPGGRLYRSGDLGRLRPAGEVEYLGRLDHQVKVRGYRIELGEIAAALEEHPAVRQAVVTLRGSKDGDRRLVAHVVPAGAPPAGDELREHLERKLPSYMVPVAYGVLEELPLTPHGKVDTAALPEPESGRPAGRRRVAYQPPRDPWEVELASIWEEIFQTHPIGVADNFFALGGHSFLGVQMMGKIFETFKVDLPLSALFKGPTIAQLAVELRAGAPPRRSPLVTLARGDGPAPFFCVHSAGGNVLSYFELARRLSPPRSFYALQDPRLVGDDFEPEVTVEEVAASYLEAVRGVQERGPYHLGGWSFGGVVAYEMARQLDAAGERVATLALLDAATTDEQELARKDDAEVLAELFRDLGVTAEGLRGPTVDAPLERLLAVLEERGLLREQAVELARARRLLEVFKSHQRAFRGYRFRPYGGPATLFRASVAPETGDPVAEGWRRLVPGLEVVRVPGDHNTMVREPHAQTLAERLSAVLERAADEGGEGDV